MSATDTLRISLGVALIYGMESPIDVTEPSDGWYSFGGGRKCEDRGI